MAQADASRSHPSGFDEDEVARLRLAFARITRSMDRHINRDDLTRTQFSVLAVIANRGPVGPADIAAIEGLNPTMLSRILGKLEDAGLIERQTDPDDRRAAFLLITARGRTLHQRVRRDRTAVLASKLAELDADQTRLLREAMDVLEVLSASPLGVSLPDETAPEPRTRRTTAGARS